MSKALLIIAQNGYQDLEYSGTRKELEKAGFDVVVASKEAGTCTGKLGGSETASLALRDINVADYSRIAFIGGPGAATLASDGEALTLAQEAVRAEIPLGAICIAPTILAKAHVLEGKEATVWDGDGQQSALLEKYGATFTGETVTMDGLIVTGNGPGAAEEFGKTLARL